MVLFQQIQGIPKAFMALRNVVLELVEELRSATTGAAVQAYETKPARDALDKLIHLIVDAAMEISRRYSHSKPGANSKCHITAHKAKLSQAFLSERSSLAVRIGLNNCAISWNGIRSISNEYSLARSRSAS